MININNLVKPKLVIQDTCGNEIFRAITRQFYNKAHKILLVYDIINRESFENIIMWEKNIRNSAPVDSVIFLVGNKTDQIRKGKYISRRKK